MSSGPVNLNIQTFSWVNSLPLSTNTTIYPDYTMFATSNGYLEPYSFYQYTNQSGFVDTSTLTTTFNTALTSTTNYIGKVFMSTIPYTTWISTNNVGTTVRQTTYPFTYISSFPCTFSTFISTIPGIPPNNISTFQSTSTNFGPYPSSLYAASYPFNFTSTFTTIGTDSNMTIQTSNLWLGEGMSNLINSKKYNVFVEHTYSLWVSTVVSRPITWISTTTTIGNTSGASGRTAVTRIPNTTYTEVTNRFMFKPQVNSAFPREISLQASNYNLTIYLQSTIFNTNRATPSFDIYIPGENNFTFTLVPVTSTIIN